MQACVCSLALFELPHRARVQPDYPRLYHMASGRPYRYQAVEQFDEGTLLHERCCPTPDSFQMDGATHRNSEGSSKDGTTYRERVAEEPARSGESSGARRENDEDELGEGEVIAARGRRWWNRGQSGTYSHTHFKVYKRRWFGLAQLVLLNIVVSWDVCICWRYVE